jgi:hypothetical protein
MLDIVVDNDYGKGHGAMSEELIKTFIFHF